MGTAVPIVRNVADEIPISQASSFAAFQLLAAFVVAAEPWTAFEQFGDAVVQAGMDADSALAALRLDAEYFISSTPNDTDFADFVQFLQHLALCKGCSFGSLLRPSDATTWRPMSSASTGISRPNVAALHKQQWMYRLPQAKLLPVESHAPQPKPPFVSLPTAYRQMALSSPAPATPQSGG